MEQNAAGTIGSWDVVTLIKFVRDILDGNPTQNFQQVTADEVVAVRTLRVRDKVFFEKEASYNKVGQTGESPFQNAWVSFGAPYHPPAYWKDPLGFVHLRGVLKSGVVGSPAFTLPPGFRPPSTVGPLVVLSNNAVGRLDIGADGTVTPVAPSVNTWVNIDNIHFKAA
jgi:hypothetical protein